MSKRFLTKMMAGAALAGVALLMSSPSATIAGDFKKDKDDFHDVGYINGILVVDTAEDVATGRIWQACTKPQKPQVLAEFDIINAETTTIPVALELVFPSTDLLFFKLLALSEKFDFDKKYGYGGSYDEDSDWHGKKFDHEKKFDHKKKKDDKKDNDLFFAYQGDIELTDADLIALLADGQQLALRGSCANGVVDVFLPDAEA